MLTFSKDVLNESAITLNMFVIMLSLHVFKLNIFT